MHSDNKVSTDLNGRSSNVYSIRKFLFSAIGGTLMATVGLSTAASAQSFPTKPIRIVVHSSPGGGLDVTTRLVGQAMSEKLGQPVIIENKPGADGLLGIRYVKSMPADGYTLLAAASTLATLPAVKLDPGYSPNDFAAIGTMVRTPYLMLTSSSKPYKTVAELVNASKVKADQLSVATGGNGATSHLCAAQFMQRANIHLMSIPYKGNAAALPDLIAGRSDVMFDSWGSAGGHVKSGLLRVLGVTSSERIAQLPDVPTIAEQGYPNFSYDLWLGLLAPAGTPKDVIQTLSSALNAALKDPKVVQRAREEGTEPLPLSPEKFTEMIQADFASNASLVTKLGISKE